MSWLIPLFTIIPKTIHHYLEDVYWINRPKYTVLFVFTCVLLILLQVIFLKIFFCYNLGLTLAFFFHFSQCFNVSIVTYVPCSLSKNWIVHQAENFFLKIIFLLLSSISCSRRCMAHTKVHDSAWLVLVFFSFNPWFNVCFRAFVCAK